MKSNPFVSISDLMAGVTAAVMLLLVVAVVQSASIQADHEAKKRKGIENAIAEIKESISSNTEGIVVSDSVITLADYSFERGSACLNGSVESVLKNTIAPILERKLKEYPNISIQIEGHSDAAAVQKPNTNLSKSCALFDDNYSLSAGRAREARKAVLSGVQGDASISRRIAVVGFGPDRLINTKRPMAAENRRVEIRLISGGI